ncbi:uncharacterized protein LOC102607047 isoform X3 [Citrus sinensis]|uniref:uncharacterized protein LOC102607047 isoform X3 n=1 Tax=Citrus sinensis TaxID=2711 RepID=UPI000D625D5D|nr:uncharacterized protein LOC102607047 isoform X3 [Citrus sinensis]
MEKPEAEQEETNWSEAVEDLVEAGNTEAAISLLESTISKLEKIEQSQPTKESLNLQLASALTNLANLYSSNGFSLKSDHLLSRAFQIRDAAANIAKKDSKDTSKDTARNSSSTDVKSFGNDKLPQDGSSDDDWEAMADRDPDELLSSQGLPEVSKLSLEDTGVKVQAPKRRGRGTFSYKKNELYSDWQDDKSIVEDAEVDDDSSLSSESKTELRHSLEARNHIQLPFKMRILDEDDIILASVSPRDLEPPRQRPQTSARTAQRLIAQSMGLKLPTTFGSKELKNQEEARRNRIQTRQKLRDDAWGPDDVN